MKESELLAEAGELMKKMKDMPGMGDLQGMLSKMGMSSGKGSGKVNVSAMQSNLDQKLKQSQNRDRLLKKLDEKKAQQMQAQQMQAQQMQAQQMQQALAQFQAQAQLLASAGVHPPTTPSVFSTGETIERSSRDTDVIKKKKKKNKNKK